MTEYGHKHTDGSRSGGQPVDTRQKAHTMVLEVLAEWWRGPRRVTPKQLAVATTEALCRAIDQLEDLRQPTQSDALRDQLLQECLVKLRDVQGTEAPKQYACNLIKRIERVLEE